MISHYIEEKFHVSHDALHRWTKWMVFAGMAIGEIITAYIPDYHLGVRLFYFSVTSLWIWQP